MPSIDANTGRFFAPAEWREDVRQDAIDRLLTHKGDRLGRPGYGADAADLASITLPAATDALESGSGAIASVDRARYIQSELILDVTAKPPPANLEAFWVVEADAEPFYMPNPADPGGRWIPGVRPTRGQWVPIPLSGVTLPDEWAINPPGTPPTSIRFRAGPLDGLNRNAMVFSSATGYWLTYQPGYPAPYRDWYLYIRRGMRSAWVALDVPGLPTGTGPEEPIWIWQYPSGNEQFAARGRPGSHSGPLDPILGVNADPASLTDHFTIGLFKAVTP